MLSLVGVYRPIVGDFNANIAITLFPNINVATNLIISILVLMLGCSGIAIE